MDELQHEIKMEFERKEEQKATDVENEIAEMQAQEQQETAQDEYEKTQHDIKEALDEHEKEQHTFLKDVDKIYDSVRDAEFEEARDRAMEDQQSCFEEWLSENKDDLMTDFIADYEDEFSEYCKKAFEEEAE